jgi:soluble lytic murein transglycosylase-like protein
VDQIVEEAALRHEVDPLLAKSVLAVESAYNQFATSPKGAMGFMQLMPGTARQLGVTNAYDARQNIEGGVKFLRYLKSKFNDERLVLAAYNAGEAAVKKHGWIPPYPETIEYVYKVGKRYGEARREARNSATALPNAKSDAASAPKPEPRIAQVVDAEGRIHLRIP